MAPLSHDCFPAHRVAKPPCSSSHFLSRSTNQSPPLHPLPQICIKFLLHTALPLFKTATRLFSDHRCTQCAPLCTQCAPGQPPPKCNIFTLSPTHAQHVCTFTHPPRSQISYQAFNQQYHMCTTIPILELVKITMAIPKSHQQKQWKACFIKQGCCINFNLTHFM